MNDKSHARLWLYIVIGTLPAIVEWLTLTYDVSPRGLSILAAKTLLSAAVTARAYIDSGGKPSEPEPQKSDV
jgi:hypothetical protein